MNKTKIIGSLLVGVLAFGSSIATANADSRAVLETEPCVLTLPAKVIFSREDFAQFSTGIRDSKTFKSTIITSEMLTCPAGVEPNFDRNIFTGNDDFRQDFMFSSNINPAAEAYVRYQETNIFDSVANEVVYKQVLTIEGTNGIFDNLVTKGDGGAKPYLRINGKNYELKLAKSFELIIGHTLGTGACVVNLPNLINYYSDSTGEKNTTYISRSNLNCPSETNGHSLAVQFEDRENGVVFLDERGNKLFLDACYEERLNIEAGMIASNFSFCVHSNSSQSGTFAKVKPSSRLFDRQTGISYPVVLAAPFKVKRATDVTAKVKRSGSYLSINIQADRNYAVDNNRGSTNRRQTVIVNDKADRAVIKRGNKVIATVKLSMYGYGKVKIRDIAGKNNYTVTLIETDGNYAGVTSFKK